MQWHVCLGLALHNVLDFAPSYNYIFFFPFSNGLEELLLTVKTESGPSPMVV